MEFSGCYFQGCNFLDLDLTEIKMTGCEFKHCVIGNLKTNDVFMSNCSFRDCILIGIDWNCLNTGKLPPFSYLGHSAMRYNFFTGFTMKKYDFENCSFEGCNFESCDLTGTNFKSVNLKESQFHQCNLSKCDFCQATDYRIDIKNNIMKNAKFSLPEALGLFQALDIIIE